MASERFSGDEDEHPHHHHHHHHQHQHQHQQKEQFNPGDGCWCKGASNLGEVKWVQDFMALVENTMDRKLLSYLPLLQKSVLSPNSSSPLHQAESSASSTMELQFKGDIPDTLLTMDKIEDEGASLEVELLDSGKRVQVGPESSVKIQIDVLDGDFDVEEREDWTEEDYAKYVATPRKTKGPLLKGKCGVEMSRGVASVSHIAFTDNSKSMRNGTFRLGAKVVRGLPPGVVVKAAVSKAFTVKERRLKNDRKHKVPSAEDDLWRLVNIRNNGQIYKRAVEAGIRTVKDFLQYYHVNPKNLQHILRVPQNNWNAIVKNAEACKLTDEHYRYYDNVSGDVLLLDWAFNIKRVAFKGQNWQPYKALDDFQKKKADILRRTAYEKRSELAIIEHHLPVPPSMTPNIGEHHPPPSPPIMDPNISEHHTPQPTGMDPNVGEHNPPPPVIDPNIGEHHQPTPPPPPNMDQNIDGFCWDTPFEGNIRYNQMWNISPTYTQNFHSMAYQGTCESFFSSPLLGSSHEYNNPGEATMSLWEMDEVDNCRLTTPQQKERSNISKVSGHGCVTSKLLAAFYVTKAASLFMISFQRDLSAPSKKRKLQ